MLFSSLSVRKWQNCFGCTISAQDWNLKQTLILNVSNWEVEQAIKNMFVIKDNKNLTYPNEHQANNKT